MKVLGIKKTKLSKIIKPGNWKEILERQSAQDRGKSYREMGGYIHEPVLRRLDGKLHIVAGRDRLAGAELEGYDSIPCKHIECDDEEAKSWEEVENIERRYDPKELKAIIARRVARLAAQMEPDKPSGPGRPRSARRKAIERVAAERNVTPRAVEQAIWRKEKADAAEAARLLGDEPEPEEKGPPIRTLGMDLEDETVKELGQIQQHIDTATRGLTATAAALGRLEKAGLNFPASVLSRLQEQHRAAGRAIRQYRPEMLCPYCKMVPGAMDNCAACLGVGWRGKLQPKEQIPDELWEEENPRVSVAGELRYVSEMFEEEDPLEAMLS